MHFFTVPALQPEAMQTELNTFLSRERVLATRREFMADDVTRTLIHVA
jgi:hypothetical protein